MSKQEVDLNKLRKRVFNEVVEINEVILETSGKGDYQSSRVGLVLKDGRTVTHKLKKELETKSKDESLGIMVISKTKEDVKQEEVNKYFPEVYKQIIEALKKQKPMKAHISYSQSALEFDGQITKYYTMYKSDVESIYSSVIHKTEELLEKMLERQENYEKGKKTTATLS